MSPKAFSFVTSALVLCTLATAPLTAQNRGWQFSSYGSAMSGSGRDLGTMNQGSFDTAQQRKQKYLDAIRAMLTRDFGAADPAVMQAFEQVPREYYMYNYETGHNMGSGAYEVPAQEWKIGYGSVLTDYIM